MPSSAGDKSHKGPVNKIIKYVFSLKHQYKPVGLNNVGSDCRATCKRSASGLAASITMCMQDERSARRIANSLMDANAAALVLGKSRAVTQIVLGGARGGTGVASMVEAAELSHMQLQEVRVPQILRACGLGG